MAYAGWHAWLDRRLCVVENVGAAVAGIVLVAMMLLVSADAILRHAFAAPLTFQLTLTESYLLVAMAMLAMPWGYRKGGTIQVRLLLDACPRAFNNVVIRIALLAASAYMAALAWFGWRRFYDAWLHDDVTMGVIDWPVDWSWVWVPIGCALLSLRVLLDAVAPVLRPIGSDHEVETESPEPL